MERPYRFGERHGCDSNGPGSRDCEGRDGRCKRQAAPRSIQVEARGEVAELKDNINTMINHLRATTERNQEQDWLKTNLAKFTRMLQGQRDLVTVGKMLLSELAPLVHAQQGTVYQMEHP